MHHRSKETSALDQIRPSPIASVAAATAATAAARQLRALSPEGAVAATFVGSAILSGAGLRGAAATLTFFVSSTLLGRLPRSPRHQQRRGNVRDAVQVLANGGVAAALAIVARTPTSSSLPIAGFAGALAAATADTWATEIGSRASARPRSIVTGKSVPVGSSGGVSWAGLLASAVGAASIAAVTSIGTPRGQPRGGAPMRAVALGGFCGALADSLLGATVQEVRMCPVCGEETELPRHQCGTPTTTVRGISWVSNDIVNLVSTLVGATVTMMLARSSRVHPGSGRPRTARHAP